MDKLEYQKQYYYKNKEKVKAYQNENKEKILQYQKEYYKNNKDKKREYCLQNAERLNEKIVCSCGGRYTFRNKAQHLKSQKHQKYINSIQTDTHINPTPHLDSQSIP